VDLVWILLIVVASINGLMVGYCIGCGKDIDYEAISKTYRIQPKPKAVTRSKTQNKKVSRPTKRVKKFPPLSQKRKRNK